MNIRHALATVALVMAAPLSLDAGAEATWLDADCQLQMSPQQARLYRKWNEGGEVLRRFVFARRSILEVDVDETIDWATAVDRAHAKCLGRIGQLSLAKEAPDPQFAPTAETPR